MIIIPSLMPSSVSSAPQQKKTPAEINSLKRGAGDGMWKKVDYHRGRLSCVRIGGRMK